MIAADSSGKSYQFHTLKARGVLRTAGTGVNGEGN